MAALPVSPEVAPTMVTHWPAAAQFVVEQSADELDRDVLERERRPVEELEQPVAAAEIDERRDLGGLEGGVRVGDKSP